MEFIAALLAMARKYMTDHLDYVLLILSITLSIALIIFFVINWKLSRLIKLHRQMMRGADGQNLEKILLDEMAKVDTALKELDKLTQQHQALAAQTQCCVQRIGIVRFNAFEDTGSDLSFAVAMLDNHNNGVVISSLFGRSETRTYAKPIHNGSSQYNLSKEEQEALQQAQKKKS